MQSKTFMVFIRAHVTAWSEKRVDLLHYQRSVYLIIGKMLFFSSPTSRCNIVFGSYAAYNRLIIFHLIIRDIKQRSPQVRSSPSADATTQIRWKATFVTLYLFARASCRLNYKEKYFHTTILFAIKFGELSPRIKMAQVRVRESEKVRQTFNSRAA